MKASSVRVAIVEDHPLMRKAVEELLSENQYAVAATAVGYSDGFAAAMQKDVDAVIVDLSLGDDDGFRLIRDAKEGRPDLPVIVYSMHLGKGYVENAFRAGAGAYVAKSEVAGTLLQALEEVLAGRVYLSPRLVPIMMREWVDRKRGTDHHDELSPMEIEVFRLFGMGYSVKEISLRLDRSPKTVETHCARIKKKLRLANNRDLLRHAIEAVRESGRESNSKTGPR